MVGHYPFEGPKGPSDNVPSINDLYRDNDAREYVLWAIIPEEDTMKLFAIPAELLKVANTIANNVSERLQSGAFVDFVENFTSGGMDWSDVDEDVVVVGGPRHGKTFNIREQPGVLTPLDIETTFSERSLKLMISRPRAVKKPGPFRSSAKSGSTSRRGWFGDQPGHSLAGKGIHVPWRRKK